MTNTLTLKNTITISTHSGLVLQHIRYNSECNVYEELEPIDKNLQYDFDFQQINILSREFIIKLGIRVARERSVECYL